MRRILTALLALVVGFMPISASAQSTLNMNADYNFVNELLISSLTVGDCVQATTGGQLVSASGPCGTGSGTVTAVTGSGNILSSGGTTPNITTVAAPTFAGALTAGSVTTAGAVNAGSVSASGAVSGATVLGTGLTSGNCVQASTGGLLTTTASPCGTGSGTVTSVTGTANQITSTNPTTTPVLSIPTTFIAPGSIASTTSITDGGLSGSSGDCVQLGAAGILTAVAGGCALSGSGVTSVTSANALNTISPTTGAVVVTGNETPTFTGAVSGASYKAGNLTSGDCLSSTAGVIVSTSTACAAGGGSVTSVTSANSLISVANPTTTPVLTANETPTFTGTVTAPTFASTNAISSAFTFSSSGNGCVYALGTVLAYSGFGSCVAVTGATFVIPAIGSSVTVTQASNYFVTDDYPGEPFTITDGTHIISGHVTTLTSSGVSFPFTVDSITAGAVGNTMTGAAQIYSGGISTTVANPVIATAPTMQKFLSGSGTYTTPAGVKWIRILAVGGGGGGGGTATSTGVNGSAGGNTTFGTSLISANGGGGGGGGTGTLAAGGLGGGSSLGVGPLGTASTGDAGGNSSIALGFSTGNGGGTCLQGGTLASITVPSNGNPGPANSGAGGSGAANTNGGAGGGGAGCVNAIIDAPLATYAYVVDPGGAGGAATHVGGQGGSGVIVVEEHYNY